MIKVSITGMVVSLKTDLRFPIPGQQGHEGRIIHLLAEIYSFAGLFMSMSNTVRTFYPITAIFGISGYYETTIQDYFCSLGILILCGCISAILLTINEQI